MRDAAMRGLAEDETGVIRLALPFQPRGEVHRVAQDRLVQLPVGAQAETVV
jgi:hypothetical protein